MNTFCQVEGWEKGHYKKFKKCESDSSSEDDSDDDTEPIKPIKTKSKNYTKLAIFEELDSE